VGNESPVIHGEFTVERELAATPGPVFAAFAEPEVRRRWFRMPGARADASHSLDFRVGGVEVATGVFAPMGGDAERLEYHATFCDIVPESRVVFSYVTIVNDVRRWAALVTVVLTPSGAGTLLRRTEQYVFLAYTGDGAHDVAHLRGSGNLQLNALEAALANLNT
jgi:uncharacterized protein YndB with AHSA1/START domain